MPKLADKVLRKAVMPVKRIMVEPKMVQLLTLQYYGIQLCYYQSEMEARPGRQLCKNYLKIRLHLTETKIDFCHRVCAKTIHVTEICSTFLSFFSASSNIRGRRSFFAFSENEVYVSLQSQ